MTFLPSASPVLMGILNVTPDSFSDGGAYAGVEDAIAHGLRLADEGAQILDVGGESTRPGAEPVDPAEEIRRVVPVIAGLRGRTPYLSVDTRHAATMAAALEAGANFINDVSALTHDPGSLRLVAEANVPVCLMHMQGDPGTMQEAPHYDSVVDEVYAFLDQRIAACEAAGIDRARIVVDPGIGFGKTAGHNLTLLAQAGRFRALGVPVLLGASRKRFIAAVDREGAPETRAPGSLAAVLAARAQGIGFFRVHDVAATRQALAVFDTIAAHRAAPTLHLIHGYIGAGKSTFSQRLAARTGAVRLNADEGMCALYGSNPTASLFAEAYARLEAYLLEMADKFLRAGQDVILDFGFWRRAERDVIRRWGADRGARVVLYRVSAPDALMAQRTAQRTQTRPPGALFIDSAAFESLRQGFEPLQSDESCVEIDGEAPA